MLDGKAWRASSEAAVGAAVSEGGENKKSYKRNSSSLNTVWDIFLKEKQQLSFPSDRIL